MGLAVTESNLFVSLPWEAKQLAWLCEVSAYPNPERWRGFVRRLQAVGIVYGDRDTIVSVLKARCSANDVIVDQEMNYLIRALTRGDIPVVAQPAPEPEEPGHWDIRSWENTPLAEPPFHAAFCAVGGDVHSALQSAFRAHACVGFVDPYLLGKEGRGGALSALLALAAKCEVTHLELYCTWATEKNLNLPQSAEEAKACVERARGALPLEIDLYAAKKTEGSFHDRFVAFGSPGSRPETARVVAVGIGVAAFSLSGRLPVDHRLRHTTLARVAASAYVQERAAYATLATRVPVSRT